MRVPPCAKTRSIQGSVLLCVIGSTRASSRSRTFSGTPSSLMITMRLTSAPQRGAARRTASKDRRITARAQMRPRYCPAAEPLQRHDGWRVANIRAAQARSGRRPEIAIRGAGATCEIRRWAAGPAWASAASAVTDRRNSFRRPTPRRERGWKPEADRESGCDSRSGDRNPSGPAHLRSGFSGSTCGPRVKTRPRPTKKRWPCDSV